MVGRLSDEEHPSKVGRGEGMVFQQLFRSLDTEVESGDSAPGGADTAGPYPRDPDVSSILSPKSSAPNVVLSTVWEGTQAQMPSIFIPSRVHDLMRSKPFLSR